MQQLLAVDCFSNCAHFGLFGSLGLAAHTRLHVRHAPEGLNDPEKGLWSIHMYIYIYVYTRIMKGYDKWLRLCGSCGLEGPLPKSL